MKQKKHLESIRLNYSNSKFFNLYFPNFEKTMIQDFNKLSDLNKVLFCIFVKN